MANSKTTDTVTGYKIDYANNTLIMNYKFSGQAMIYGSPEYNIRKNILSDYPKMKTVVKAGRENKKASKTKNLTFENMKKYIKEVDPIKLSDFEKAKETRYTSSNKYKYVKDWFIENFPNYATHKSFGIDTAGR